MKNKIYLIPESPEEVRVLREELKLPMFTISDIRHTSGPLKIFDRYECTMEQFEAIQQRINQISNDTVYVNAQFRDRTDATATAQQRINQSLNVSLSTQTATDTTDGDSSCSCGST
jgi:hypothetical protein